MLSPRFKGLKVESGKFLEGTAPSSRCLFPLRNSAAMRKKIRFNSVPYKIKHGTHYNELTEVSILEMLRADEGASVCSLEAT